MRQSMLKRCSRNNVTKNNICNPTTFETDHTRVPLTCVAEKVKVPHWRAGRAVKILCESLPYRQQSLWKERPFWLCWKPAIKPSKPMDISTDAERDFLPSDRNYGLHSAPSSGGKKQGHLKHDWLLLSFPFFFFLLYKVILCFTVMALSPFFK